MGARRLPAAPSWRRPLIVLVVIAVLLGMARLRRLHGLPAVVTQVLAVPGCQAGTGNNAVALDFGQAADAATIAGVAVRERLPSRALTIAYATAFQESKLENLTYGDRDSVGIFQQRPSEGWGTTAQLEDPAYAAQAFFGALVKVPSYTTIPVYAGRAGRAEERRRLRVPAVRADRGAARRRLHQPRRTRSPAGTTRPAGRRARASPPKLNLHGAAEELDHVFGTPGQGRRGADRGQPQSVRDRLTVIAATHGRRLGRGELARHPRQLVRDHAGQLRRVPVDGGAERNKLAGGLGRDSGGYCRQLARRTTILCGS